MQTFILTLHILASILLVGLILLQAGKGASMGAVFGGGGSNTVFGARGPATFFQKFTVAVAVLFLSTSIGLARFAKTSSSSSVIDSAVIPGMEAPATEQPVESE